MAVGCQKCFHGDFSRSVYKSTTKICIKEHEGKVLRLRKALYGPKQSPHAWFDGICQAILQYGYDRCNVDHIVFIKLRVIKLSCCKKKLRVEFLSNLKSRIGEFKYFLGMKVKGAVIALCNVHWINLKKQQNWVLNQLIVLLSKT